MLMSKYKNEKSKSGEYTFDSIKEKKRYEELKMLEKASLIFNIEIQPKYLLADKFTYNGKTEKSINYIADFRYVDSNGKIIVEDVKGFKTDVYKIKKKLFLSRYGSDIIFKET